MIDISTLHVGDKVYYQPVKKLDKAKRQTLHVCYVCEHKITGEPVYVGQELYRHKRCEPGSARWMRSKRAAVSEVTQYFVGVEGCGGEEVKKWVREGML